MTFDPTPEQARRLDDVRRVALTIVAPAAAAIDASGHVPESVDGAVAALGVWAHTNVDAVLALEELAAASAVVAARVALGRAETGGAGLAGLRGVALMLDPTDRQQLAMAAVCLGIGRAALHEALAVTRARGERPAGEPADPPHWALADAATELDAARLLVRAVAQGAAIGAAAALVLASRAAASTVDAALRIVGPEAYQAGHLLERCGRDARAASLLLGTEDAARRRAGYHSPYGDGPPA